MNEMAEGIIKLLEDKKADNIEFYDLDGSNPFFDYVIICTAANIRQLESLADNIDDYLALQNKPTRYIEGSKESGWILVDANDIIIHIFTADERERVNLDQLLNARRN